MSLEILDCLKRKRDICIKNIIPSQNTAFRWTPALTKNIPRPSRLGIVSGFNYPMHHLELIIFTPQASLCHMAQAQKNLKTFDECQLLLKSVFN